VGIDVLSYLQDRIARSYEEQVWVVAILGAMNGFVISQADKLKTVLNPSVIVWGIRCVTLLGILFVWSRHGVYMFYDRQVKQLVESNPDYIMPQLTLFEIAAREAVAWSGVLLYTLVITGMAYASVRVIRSRRRS